MKPCATATALMYAPGGRKPLSAAAIAAHHRASVGQGTRAATATPTRPRKLIFIGDVHVPFQDDAAVACTLKAIHAWQPDEVWQAGDLCEAGQWSRHGRKARTDDKAVAWQLELAHAAHFWDEVHRAAPRASCHWRLGNHEGRIERELLLVPWGEGIADLVSPETVVGASRPWLKIHPYNTRSDSAPLHVLPDLVAPHGAAAGVHATAAHLPLFAPFSVLHGHTHRVAHVVRRLASGTLQHSLSPGCLSQLQPAWAGERPTGWAHGLGFIHVRADLSWSPHLATIDHGRLLMPTGEDIRA